MANWTRFITLNTSVRNSRLNRSVIDVFFNSEKLKLLIPGPRIVGSVRLSLPSVKAAGTVKHETLNQPFNLDCAEPLMALLQPGTTLGRSPRLKPVTFGVAVSASGKPS